MPVEHVAAGDKFVSQHDVIAYDADCASGVRILLRGGEVDAGSWAEAVRRQGEPWTFGFDPAALPGYLAARGMRLALDLSTRDAAERYLQPLGRMEDAAAFYRVAEAEIQ